MQLVSKSFASPGENLALDEALLDYCDENEQPGFLRFWESAVHFVVLGYAKKVTDEVQVENCRDLGIPILRRCSGGGTVLQGPGCLNYTLVLLIESHPELESITGANRYIMHRHRAALESILKTTVLVQGCTDLTTGGLKFSGNAQRRKRRALLFHGSFLLGMDLELVERTLKPPLQEPDYRQKRSHRDFLMNLTLSRDLVRETLTKLWSGQAFDSFPAELHSRTMQLAAGKYQSDEWNLRF